MDFSSLLASAAACRDGASASPARNNQASRKRPHPGANAKPSPSFPSLHGRNKREGSFELSFLCIGAQKAGTTWLHTQLQKCPRLSLPKEQKEVHFWDWHWKRGFDWYVRQFDHPPRSSNAKNGDDGSQSHSRLHGEITPCYVVLPPVTIAEIHRCFPHLKIVFVARDLVDRAWSAMIMELRDQSKGLNPGEFADGAGGSSKKARKGPEMSVAQRRRIQQQSSPESQPDSYYLERLQSETHSQRSDYATHLRNWYERFPTSAVLLVDYREIESDPRGVLQKIAIHVGVGEEEAKDFVERLCDKEVRRRVNVATNAKSDRAKGDAATTSQHSLAERPRLKKQMEAYLRPHAAKFNALLEEKGYSWKIAEYEDCGIQPIAIL